MTVSSGATTVQSFGATTGNFSALLTASNGFTVSSGTSNLQDLKATTAAFSGLLTAQNAFTVSSGTSTLQDVKATPGTFSSLLTAQNGLTVSSGATSLQATTTTTLGSTTGTFSGVLTAQNGFNVSSGTSTLSGGSSLLGQVKYGVQTTAADFSGGTTAITTTVIRLTNSTNFQFPSASTYSGQAVKLLNVSGSTITVLTTNTDAASSVSLINGGKLIATSDGFTWLIGI